MYESKCACGIITKNIDSEIKKTIGEMTQKKFEKKYKENIINSFMFSGKFK